MTVWDLADLSKPRRFCMLPRTPACRRPRRSSAPCTPVLKDGKEVWISLWGGKTDQSAIVVYDDATLKGEEGDHRSQDDHAPASSTCTARSTTSIDAEALI